MSYILCAESHLFISQVLFFFVNPIYYFFPIRMLTGTCFYLDFSFHTKPGLLSVLFPYS